MSAFALDYPNSLPLRRSFNVRWIIILVAGLVLVASIILVASLSSVKVDSPSSVVAIPVPVAPVVDAQAQPVFIATPALSPVVIAVPVEMPHSQ